MVVSWQRVQEPLKWFQSCRIEPSTSITRSSWTELGDSGIRTASQRLISTCNSEIVSVIPSPVAKQPSFKPIHYACVQRHVIFHIEMKYFGREGPRYRGEHVTSDSFFCPSSFYACVNGSFLFHVIVLCLHLCLCPYWKTGWKETTFIEFD